MSTAERLLELQARPVLDAAQIRELTGLSIPTIRAAIASGDLPPKRVGRRVLVPTHLVMAWLGAEPARTSPDPSSPTTLRSVS